MFTPEFRGCVSCDKAQVVQTFDSTRLEQNSTGHILQFSLTGSGSDGVFVPRSGTGRRTATLAAPCSHMLLCFYIFVAVCRGQSGLG